MTVTPILYGAPTGPGSGQILPYDFAPVGEPAAVEWFGAYPYLDTPDGATSYGVQALYTYIRVGVLMPPMSLSVGATVTGSFQIRFDFVGTNYPGFRLLDRDAAVGDLPAGLLASTTHPGVEQVGTAWTSGSVEFTVTSDIRDAAARGDLCFFRSAATVDSFSFMSLATSRPIATRVYPRADGLGMGAPRLMDGRSPYRSERVFGTP